MKSIIITIILAIYQYILKGQALLYPYPSDALLFLIGITARNLNYKFIYFKPCLVESAIDCLISVFTPQKITNIKNYCETNIVYANYPFNRNVHDPPVVAGV